MQGILTYEELVDNLSNYPGIDPVTIFKLIGDSGKCPGCDQPLRIMCQRCQEGTHVDCAGIHYCHCWHKELFQGLDSFP